MSPIIAPAPEPGTFPIYSTHAEYVRAFYENRYDVTIAAGKLTIDMWELKGSFPDESYPVTEEGAPDWARFDGQNHLLDFVRRAKAWEAEPMVAIFSTLGDAVDMEFVLKYAIRCVVRVDPENAPEAWGAALQMLDFFAESAPMLESGRDLEYLVHGLERIFRKFPAGTAMPGFLSNLICFIKE